MIPTNEEIRTAAEAWAGEFKTGEWFERLRIEAFEAGADYVRQNSAKPIVSGSLPPTKDEIETEAEGRYPVKTHSSPDNSPYVGSKATFIHGVHWGIQKMGGNDR